MKMEGVPVVRLEWQNEQIAKKKSDEGQGGEGGGKREIPGMTVEKGASIFFLFVML